MTSLNPVYKIGDQISESVILHQKLNPKDARDRSIEMLKMVGIPSPEKRVDDYPHQLSGGMRQRVMIAMALSCNPEILIADEPTTALDVTIQAQILDLLGELKEKIGMAMILITHDLGVVSQVADDILVMYSGRAVEFGSVSEVMKNPKMPYTRGLLECLPRFEHGAASTQNKIKVRRKLETIPGMVPSLLSLPSGCRFRDRCSYSVTECSQSEPELRGINSSGSSPHLIRCIKDI
jgi:oligopeptide/dipeptide ABC transporter ATP-binding protein